MTDFKRYTVQDVISLVIDYRGKTPKKLGGDWTESGYRALSAKNVKTGKIVQPESIRFVSEEMYTKWMKDEIQRGDILITSEAPFGQIYYWDNDEKIVLSQRLFAIRINDKFYPKYIYLYMTSARFQAELEGRATGTTVTGLRQPELLKCEIIAPDYDTQVKIADFLYAIEKKANINEEINRNLLEQIKTIFDSWFYKMEPFDGKEPEGTEYVPLEKLCTSVTKGTTPTTLGMSFTEEGINFIKGESILDNHGFDRTKVSHISEETHEKLKRSQIKTGDIVFTIAGTLGRFALIDDSVVPANTNQAVAIVRAEKVSPEYLYSFFLGNWHNDYYTKRIQQAVQANLSLGIIKSLPIAVLPKQYYEQYLEIINPIISETKKIEIEILKLGELRDSLLPKLMSGELDVSDLDI